MNRYDEAPINYKARLWFGIAAGLLIGWLACFKVTKIHLPPILPVVTSAGMEVNVVDVYDGDTFYIDVEGWPEIVGKRMKVRVNGIQAPEVRGGTIQTKEKAYESKEYAVKQLLGTKSPSSDSYYNKPTVYLKNIKRGKYFRLIADVYIKRYHKYEVYDFAELMVNESQATRYADESKKANEALDDKFEVTFKCTRYACKYQWTEKLNKVPSYLVRVKCPSCGFVNGKYQGHQIVE